MINLDAIFQQILNFTGTFNLNLALLLFIICFLGEFHISVPYLLETLWLLTGYNLGTHLSTFGYLVLLWGIAQAGRQAGAIALFYLSMWGSSPIVKFYRKHFAANLTEKVSANNALPFKMLRHMSALSPFSIALGRLFWLRIPLTMMLGVQRHLKIMVIGVLISSVIWDGTYIVLGLIGGTAQLKPYQMVLYSLVGLTALYIVTFTVQRISKFRASKKILPANP